MTKWTGIFDESYDTIREALIDCYRCAIKTKGRVGGNIILWEDGTVDDYTATSGYDGHGPGRSEEKGWIQLTNFYLGEGGCDGIDYFDEDDFDSEEEYEEAQENEFDWAVDMFSEYSANDYMRKFYKVCERAEEAADGGHYYDDYMDD